MCPGIASEAVPAATAAAASAATTATAAASTASAVAADRVVSAAFPDKVRLWLRITEMVPSTAQKLSSAWLFDSCIITYQSVVQQKREDEGK